MTSRRLLFLFCVLILALDGPARAFDVPLVPVGDVGNAADTTGFGAVAYAYRIGTYEVTNGQYVVFLNAVAKSDALGLFNPAMASDPDGGITRSGASGSFTYALKPNFASKPVNFVSFYDSLRFINWLSNGQPNGGTEDGSYTLLGSAAIPTNAAIIARNSTASFVLPSEDEWYKAAYYQGDTHTYTLYPTRSDTAPAAIGPNSDNANSANYKPGNIPAVGTLTNVGAYALATSFYGTFDQGGNIIERDEQLFGMNNRGSRGGSFRLPGNFLQSTTRDNDSADGEFSDIGFRVAVVSEATPTPAPTATPTPTPQPTPPPRPIVKISGRNVRIVHTARVPLRGTASDAHGKLARVEIKIGGGDFHPAHGTKSWRRPIHLHPGRTRIVAQAVDQSRAVSPTDRVTLVFRR